jgi:CheY-like chemotaxis protein
MRPAKSRILCVDDNADICEMLTSLLGHAGYDVTTAATIVEALRLAEGGFDLFILDKMEPHDTGLELCRELRRRHPDTPIIVYSADAFERHHKEAFEAGATRYVNKPDTAALVEAVRNLLG